MTARPDDTSRTSPATPTGGIPVAPRSRRRDHLSSTITGIVLAPVTIVLAGLASRLAADGEAVIALVLLGILLVTTGLAEGLFARRSSVGGLAAGLTALAAQAVILIAPLGAQSAPFAWARDAIPTGVVLIVASLHLGGSWGMRRARRDARARALADARLAEQDRTMGQTPTAPPSRRHDHLLSFPAALVLAAVGLALIEAAYARLVSGDPSILSWIAGGAALMCLAAAGALTARSTLGARVVGPLLVVLSLPGLLGRTFDSVPLCEEAEALLKHDPSSIALVVAGLLLMAIGWGAHLARRQGRSSEQARLRAGTATPAEGLPLGA